MRKLGFGGMRLPRLIEDDPKSIDQAQVNKMADYFIEHGFTYFDTAYPYHQGLSEGAFKKAVVDRYPKNLLYLQIKCQLLLYLKLKIIKEYLMSN